MAKYDNVPVVKLVFKISRPRSRIQRRNRAYDKDPQAEEIDDSPDFGGWWKTKKCLEISGQMAIQFGQRRFVKALDDGFLMLGPAHKEGEGPSPDEIFTSVRISNIKIAIQSCYGKFMREERDGQVTARSDSVGSSETWEPIFQRGKMALLTESKYFLSIHPQDRACVAFRRKVRAPQIAVIRCNGPRVVAPQTVPQITGPSTSH